MRLVLDTNILISSIVRPESYLARVVDNVFLYHAPLRSYATFQELAEVINRKKFDRYSSLEKKEKFLAFYNRVCEHIAITERIDACRDQRDNMFLELAVCGKAEVIVSGDKDLLLLSPFRDIRIINPAYFVA